MKKFFLFFLLAMMMVSMTAMAQIQKGFVRSQGTSANRKGSPLKGVKVYVKELNSPKVTVADGKFNFNLGGGKKKFSIKTVSLRGYRLLTMLQTAYNVGPAELEIVMQSDKERLDNEERIARVIEKNITKHYKLKMWKLQKEMDSIRKTLSTAKNNAEMYKGMLRSIGENIALLDKQYIQRKELIDRMVEEYVDVDYAKMDDHKSELCSYIEHGELERADSLLTTMDIAKEIRDLKMLDMDLKYKEEEIVKEKDARQNKLENICMYLRGKYDVALQRMQFDTAAVYIKQLADIDTCNIDNVFECAFFLKKQKIFKEAEKYYIICLNNLSQEGHPERSNRIAQIYNSLGILYTDIKRFGESEDMFKAALEIQKCIVKDNPMLYEKFLAMSYNNIGRLYQTINRFSESEDMYKAALSIYERRAKEMPQIYENLLFSSYMNLGTLYCDIDCMIESEKMLKSAWAICERRTKGNPSFYNYDMALLYRNLGVMYSKKNRYIESEKMYKEALIVFECLAKDNRQAYEYDLALTYKNLGNFYSQVQRFSESEDMLMAALAIYERLAKAKSLNFESDLAMTYSDLGDLYSKAQRTNESEEMYKTALAKYKNLAVANPKVYQSDLAVLYDNLGLFYIQSQRFHESENMFNDALAIRVLLANENQKKYDDDLAKSYINLGTLYGTTKRFEESEEMYKIAITIVKSLYMKNPECYQKTYMNDNYLLGMTMVKNKKYHDAIAPLECSLKLMKCMPKEKINANVYLQTVSKLILLYAKEKTIVKPFLIVKNYY